MTQSCISADCKSINNGYKLPLTQLPPPLSSSAICISFWRYFGAMASSIFAWWISFSFFHLWVIITFKWLGWFCCAKIQKDAPWKTLHFGHQFCDNWLKDKGDIFVWMDKTYCKKVKLRNLQLERFH